MDTFTTLTDCSELDLWPPECDLYVCLSVCPLAYLKSHMPILHEIAVAAYCHKEWCGHTVCRSVCLSRSWALQKRLNRSRCRGWAQGNFFFYALDGVQIPQQECTIFVDVGPTEKHWEPVLRCTQKRLNRSRCGLAADSPGPKEARIRWGSKVGRLHSPPRGVTRRQSGFLSKFIDHLLLLLLLTMINNGRWLSRELYSR